LSGFAFRFWRILLIYNNAVFIQGSFEESPSLRTKREYWLFRFNSDKFGRRDPKIAMIVPAMAA
jgi:hypothetical protein